MSQVVVGLPEQPVVPDGQVQLTKVEPVPSVAVSTTAESKGKPAEQVELGQLIPVGELVTVPFPATITVNTAELHVGVPTPAEETNAVPNT